MNKNMFWIRLGKSLPRWLGWGAACGSLSMMCALFFGEGGADAVVAMLLGILTWSGVCALITASDAYARRADSGVWDRALDAALWIRAAGTLLGALLMVVGRGVPWVAGMNLLILPDFWAGMVSIHVGHGLAGGFSEMSTGVPREFGQTYVTTLVQGAWVVFSIMFLAAIIHGLRRLRAGRIRVMGP